MASCWRNLAKHSHIELHVVCVDQFANDPSAPKFGDDILTGIDATICSLSDANDPAKVIRIVNDFGPDVVAVSGWAFKGYAALLRSRSHADVPIILCIDNPFRGDLRQRLGYYRVRRYLNRANLFAVPGKRGQQLMEFWNVPADRVLEGLYAYDEDVFHSCGESREKQTSWPKAFLYVGRMDHRKGIDILLKAYQQYRSSETAPWPLICCGNGPLQSLAANSKGVTHRDFVAPQQLPSQMLESGAFILVSRYDAWGVVIAEAMASGLPVICSDACGAADDLVDHERNGLIVPAENADALADAMKRVTRLNDEIQEWSRRSLAKAARFGSHQWAARWSTTLVDLVK